MEDVKKFLEEYFINNEIDWKRYEHNMVKYDNDDFEYYLIPFLDKTLLLDSNKNILNIFKNLRLYRINKIIWYYWILIKIY